MSTWLRLHNELKRRAPQEYFTSSQRHAYDTLCEWLALPVTRINLYGQSGAGKTFIAWGLSRALGATYLPLPAKLEHIEVDMVASTILIIDNAPNQEDAIRGLLATADLLDTSAVVFISRIAAGLKMRNVQLQLPTSDEVRAVVLNYGRLGFFQTGILPPSPNFWQIMQTCV